MINDGAKGREVGAIAYQIPQVDTAVQGPKLSRFAQSPIMELDRNCFKSKTNLKVKFHHNR